MLLKHLRRPTKEVQVPKPVEAPRPKRKAEGFDSPRPKRKAEGFSESDCSEDPEAEAAAETPPAKENELKDEARAAQKPSAKEPDDDQEKRLGNSASCTVSISIVILQRSSTIECF